MPPCWAHGCVENALVIPGGNERRVTVPVREDNEGELLAFESFLKEHLTAGRANSPFRMRLNNSRASFSFSASRTPLPAHNPSASSQADSGRL